MSEWNLSVRLTGQGSGLARTLRDLSGDARTASRNVNALRRDIDRLRTETRNPIRVRLDVDAGHLRADVRAALTSAGSGQGLRVRLGLDADHLRADVSAALSAAGAGQGLAVNLRLGNSMQLRREVEDAVRWAAWGHRIEIPIALQDPMQLRRDVSAAVRWASMNQVIRVRVDPDTSGLRTPLPGLPGGSGGGGGLDFNLGSLIPAATAVVPLIAGLAANLAPLAGTFAATGGAAAAFGIALAGQVGPLKEASEAEKAYQDAVRDHGAASKEAAQAQLAYQQQLASMPAETQKAAVALSRLKTTFGDWSDDMASFTMAPVEKGFTVLEQVIPKLSPEVEAFSGSFDRLMNVAGGAVSTPGFDAFADRVGELTQAKVDDFTDQIIHLLRVVSQGDADAGAVGQILAYFRENGPEAREAVNAIGDAVVTLAQGAAQAGPTMLTLVTAAAKLVAALPPELVAIILQTATALKLLQLSGAGMAALAGGVTRVRTSIVGLAAASTAAGGGLAGLRAAFLALGTAAKASVVVAGIAAVVLAVKELGDLGESAPPNVDRLTTSLGQLGRTGKATGYVAEQFGSDFEKLNDKISKVMNPSTVDSINNWGADVTNGLLDASDATEDFTKSADAIDESLTNLVRNGNAEQAAAALKYMTASMSPEEAARLREELDGYDSSLADLKFESDMAADSMGLFGKAAADVQAQLSAQKQAADGLRNSLVALNETNRDAYSAEINYEQALDDLTAAFKENGNTLDIHTEAGRRNGEAMTQAAAAQDEMIVSGIAAGESFATMSGKSQALRAEMLELATKGFGGNKKAAEDYVNTLLGTPAEVNTIIKAETAAAITDLEAVKNEIATTHGKTIVMEAPTAAARAQLEALGFKIEDVPGSKNVKITIPTGTPISAVQAIQSAINGMQGKNIGIGIYKTEYLNTVRTGGAIDGKKYPGVTPQAHGSVLEFYADGGMRENHVAQIAPAGAWRVWAEPSTGGESYIPLSPSKRPRSRAIAEETVRRLGGDPASIQWHANGGIDGWQYDPVSGSLYSPSEAGQAGHKTKKVKTKGGKTKEVEYFDLAAVEKKLWDLGEATAAWNRNLEKVADRAGGDVARALASMGEDGLKIAAKMATGTDKYVAQMSIALRNLEKEARARLSDFTSQLSHDSANNQIFQNNLAKLAAMGYGDLAGQLAAQNDQAAMDLAAEAAGSKSKAKKANEEVKQRKAQMTSDEMAKFIEIIAAISNKNIGIHQVADKTGLGEDEIIEVGNKGKLKLHQLLGAKALKFLQDLAKANSGKAYENGGIRAGMYATQGGIIRFAEPSTHGEAYIPLGQNKRGSATRVLGDVASRFGLGLTDGQASRVIIREQGPLVGESHFHIGDRQSDRDLARAVESRQGYQLRRLARGGVAARGSR
ncbi:hypothetical protein [Streptomyces violaceorubidus]|uniref:hypothetical protein n=1 Tax=Streptomyces violaceorubidus TaxID=284042 RepID=UPI00068EFD27|nr:hypothetical protein [Streptomyces violaceorubidus]